MRIGDFVGATSAQLRHSTSILSKVGILEYYHDELFEARRLAAQGLVATGAPASHWREVAA